MSSPESENTTNPPAKTVFKEVVERVNPNKVTIKHWNHIEVNEAGNVLTAFKLDGTLKKYHAEIDNEYNVALKIPRDSKMPTGTLLAALIELEFLAQQKLNAPDINGKVKKTES